MFQRLYSSLFGTVEKCGLTKPVVGLDVQILSYLFKIIRNIAGDEFQYPNPNNDFEYHDQNYKNDFVQCKIVGKKLNGPLICRYEDTENTLAFEGSFTNNKLEGQCSFKLTKHSDLNHSYQECSGVFNNNNIQHGTIKIYSDLYYVAKDLRIHTFKNSQKIETIHEHHLLDNYKKDKCNCILTGKYDPGKFISSDIDPEIPDDNRDHYYKYENGTINIYKSLDQITEQYNDGHKIITKIYKIPNH